jgi:hypothetical protein
LPAPFGSAKAYCLIANHYNIINTLAYAKKVLRDEFETARSGFVASATTARRNLNFSGGRCLGDRS